MLRSRFVRRTYYASIQTDQAIALLKERFALSTDSDVIRYALIRVAESPPAPLPKKKGKIT